MEYHCDKCGMGVKDIKCAKCSSPLVDASINKDGKKIQVAKCPKGCGMIKSPTCCAQDMACSV